ncbi:MAG: aminotransferase class V-fold PLP-dependent enzyme [Geminicoccaceae bacterium]|jgi:L-seryl-tRNA(Ser) seleniumtransferase
MSDDPFERWNLTPVINASGTMTSLGASRVQPETRALVDRILDSFVDIDELQSRAGAVIARLTGAEAGCITACSAAAMTQAVAACLTGTDLAGIEALPETDGENRVILPMGHMVNYGAPVDQAIRLAGASVVPIGTAAACETWHLRRALEEGAAAAMYVVSHHTVRENELPMDLFISLCREHDVPVIVDMASEYDLRGPIALGASAVIYSGHKFLSGVTSGIVAGSEDLVRAIYLQHRGIGRTMKAGKESVVGAMAALQRWETRDHDAERVLEEARVERWLEVLSKIPGLDLSRHADWTGNPITRLKIVVLPEEARAYAWEVATRLAVRNPRIVLRDDLVEHGELYLDPCNVTDDEAEITAFAIAEEMQRFRDEGDGLRRSWSEVKRAREEGILKWNGGGDPA